MIVTLYAPTCVARTEWHSRIDIEGLDEVGSFTAIGIDAFQSIENSIEAIRFKLEPHRKNLRWSCGVEEDLGFGRIINSGLNAALGNVLFESVDVAMEKSLQSKERQREKLEGVQKHETKQKT